MIARRIAPSRRLLAWTMGPLVGGMALGLAATTPALSQSIEWKMGVFTGPKHIWTVTARAISEDIAKASGGRLTIKVFDSGTLATGPGTLDAIQKGVMDAGSYIFTYSSFNQRPFFMLGGMPFVYRDAAGFNDAWTKESTLLDLANEQAVGYGYDNIQFMNAFYSGFAKLGFKDKSPKVPADLKGLKIRGTGVYLPVIEAYGAAAVSIITPEVYGGIQRGLIDGAMGLNTNWVNWKWSEPANYLVDYNFAVVAQAFTVNKKSLEALPDDLKALVGIYGKMFAAQMNTYYMELDAKAPHLLDGQMELYKPTAAEAKLWAEPKDGILKRWKEAVGEELANKALAVVDKYNK